MLFGAVFTIELPAAKLERARGAFSMTATADPFLQRMAEGDPVGLEQLYDRCGPAVYAAAMRVLQNLEAAEDTVQEVFAEAWYNARGLVARGVDAAEWLVAEARARAALRLAQVSPAAAQVSPATAQGGPGPSPSRAFDIPPMLRRRVLDSIYGAGQRLPSLYSTPRVAERIFGWLRRRSTRS
jgi:DNA-directed RNA polymerase specialized sigma24 family protein